MEQADQTVVSFVSPEGLPEPQGLYDPRAEHDACGVGFVAQIKNQPSHGIVQDALTILRNLDHRGAVGADPKAGDGCGLLTQIPDGFFRAVAAELGINLPAVGHYGVGFVFLPRDDEARRFVVETFERVTREEGLQLLGWRHVPVLPSQLGESVRSTEPVSMQIFVGRPASVATQDDFERRLYLLRKVVSNTVFALQDRKMRGYYPVSLSSRTIVYKGLLLADQLAAYYPDLLDPRFESALALVHQRFSTNTFPSWQLAHPYRMIAHNGEINTLRGNVNWMAARQASVDSEAFGHDISKIWPISYEGQSDTACFDNALEFLVQGGYALPHAMMMMIPEAWAGNPLMDDARRAFYEYHAALMEPWDGPAAIVFTDGRQIGATLDRNGLRPARYIVTKDDRLILASEAGVLPVPDEDVVTRWRLQPGKMLLVDLEQGRIVADEEVKRTFTEANPYRTWLERTQLVLEDLPDAPQRGPRADVKLLDLQQVFGMTQEDVKLLLPPMMTTGQEAVGSMGTDTPVAVLSAKPKSLYGYFQQLFAQVTNPPIDPIREELVMSLVSFIGPRPNLFDLRGTSRRKRLEVRQPILTNEDLEKIRFISELGESHFESKTLDMTYPAERGADGLEDALMRLCDRAEAAVRGGYNIIILSDRAVQLERMPIPALLATAAVHHHLIRKGLRTSVGLVVETGEAWEVHHFACLAGYGAEAINPYLAFDTLGTLLPSLPESMTPSEAIKRYIKSVDKGLLKVMSKMGISTYQSYCGAQIFEAVGLSKAFVDRFFFGTPTKVEGIGLADVASALAERHALAFGDHPLYREALDVGGDYAFRARGEVHAWDPDTVAELQHAVRLNAQDRYRAFAARINEQDDRLLTLRGLMTIKSARQRGVSPVPLDDVETAASLVKRFSTGAMSFGSISREAHTTLAVAMNRVQGKSNTGEGGEEADRYVPLPNGDSQRSAIKQVASGRFGVSAEYLVNADVIQIKVAQGAKPGEGGQLPGFKVDAIIAKVRHSTPGVGLISPPPHHDIYSIEDLAQLIFDLKCVNPRADISVKLVSAAGVGTVAAGVAKARADHITISGFEGGTGASPLTSIKHAGTPWEIGLAETQQTLVLNRLRGRVKLQVDGGLRTGRDVIIGALLGADEFGFSTAPLVAAGCIMMRKCHLNTCPVGVATQDPVLRKRFKGTPEHVINYLFFVAEEVREWLADMGFRRLEDVIGRTDLLEARHLPQGHKAAGLDFSRLFHQPEVPAGVARHHAELQHHPLEQPLDRAFIEQAASVLTQGGEMDLHGLIDNTHRSVGAMLSGVIALKRGHTGLEDNSLRLHLQGTAGQSFGAFLAHGITLTLTGEANDYVGKGLSGGRLILKPSPRSRLDDTATIIAGNTALYGALEGEAFIRGVVGERFAVRNSGAVAVVEGVGDHGCEYMTGGVVVVLGPTGRNFAAGMSGGVAYVLDEDGSFARRCNLSMVDLEPVEHEEDMHEQLMHHSGDLEFKGRIDVLPDMSRFDEERLLRLITAHARLTESPRAQDILQRFDHFRPLFVKVMPVEYRRALKDLEAQRQAVAAE